jgi:hypothetical protein
MAKPRNIFFLLLPNWLSSFKSSSIRMWADRIFMLCFVEQSKICIIKTIKYYVPSSWLPRIPPREILQQHRHSSSAQIVIDPDSLRNMRDSKI